MLVDSRPSAPTLTPSLKLVKNSATYTNASPVNSRPTGQAPARKNTVRPSTEMMMNGIDMKPLGRASAPCSRFQPIANQWMP